MNLQYRNHNVPRQQTQMNPDLQRGVENPLRRGRYLAAEPPASRVVGGREAPGPRPPSCENPEGELLDEEDPELARKKVMLQKLNEKILHKKAAIAIKSVKASVKDPPAPGDSRGEQTNVSEGGTLRDRVTQILVQRQFSLYSKLLSSKDRSKPFTLSRESLQQEHPLKLRVTALRMHRLHRSSVLPSNKEVPVPPPPPSRRINSAAEEKSGSDKGFERFVKMLNEGADTNLMDLVPDVHLPPPRQSITPAVRQESSSNKGFDLLLGVLGKEADPKIKDTVPGVHLPPPRQSAPSPVKRGSSSGCERLCALNKGADSKLKDSVPDGPRPPPAQSQTSAVRQESSSNKGFDLLHGVPNKGADPKMKDTAPDVPPAPPSRSAASPAKEKPAEKGFERFLSLLNKGVDISLLNKVAKDDREDPKVPTKTTTFRRAEPLPGVKRAEPETRGSSSDSGGQSESPPSVKKKKQEEEDPNLDEKHKQLQSILQSLGLNLNFEDLSKLTDRTQARLYGKKSERDGRSQERDGRSQERDGRSEERDGRSQERDGRSEERDGRSQERDGRSQERDGRSGERDGRSQERDGRSQERDGRSQERDGRSEERDGRSQERDGRSDERKGRSYKREQSRERDRSGERDGRSGEREGRSYEREGRSDERKGRGYKREQSRERDRSSERDGSSDEGEGRSYERERRSKREKSYNKMNYPTRSYKKHTDSRSSSSSFSSSSSSTSRSRSRSRSSSRRGRRSRSRNKRSRSRRRSRDRLRHRDRKETQRHGRKDEAFPFAHAADYSSYQYAQYINYCNTVNPYWFYQQNSLLPEQPDGSKSSPGFFPYLDYNSFRAMVDPNLALTEGQSGVDSSRCLTVVDTERSSSRLNTPNYTSSRNRVRAETQVTGWHRRERRSSAERRERRSSAERRERRSSAERRERRSSAERRENSTEVKKGPTEVIASKVKALLEKGRSLEALTCEEQNVPTQQDGNSVQSSVSKRVGLTASSSGATSKTDSSRPGKAPVPAEKKSQTEEEIKARLRMKLLAFNQKAKEMTKPQNSIIKQPEDPLASELS